MDSLKRDAAIMAGAAATLAAAVVLDLRGVPPFPTWLYVLAWYPTLALLDRLVVRCGGESLFEKPRDLAVMLWWSAVIWLGFEAINFRLQDWYYVFLPDRLGERWLGVTISLATVVPAVLLPERLLERLGAWRGLRSRPIALRARDLVWSLALGCGALGLTLAVPRIFHPLTWGAVWLVAEPLLYRRSPERSLFGDVARGEWGRIARLMAGGLLAGALWESFNALARAKWIYTVPFLEHLKLFEMPPLGFLGFPFFALEVWSLYHLVVPATRPRTLVASAAFAVLVLGGMDRWTVSSTTPRLAGLPGVSATEQTRLAGAGLCDVFRIAGLAVDSIAARAGLDPAAARRVREGARLATLRGIGTRHAAELWQGGITSVAALAQAEPALVLRLTRHGARPTPAEVRVWIRAARARY